MTRRRLSRLQRVRIFDRWRGHCHICGGKIHAERGEKWDVEHIKPLADGGADEPWNMAPAHSNPCHQGKTAEESTDRAKTVRVRANYLGIPKPVKAKLPCGRNSSRRKMIKGRVIERVSQAQMHRDAMERRYGGFE